MQPDGAYQTKLIGQRFTALSENSNIVVAKPGIYTAARSNLIFPQDGNSLPQESLTEFVQTALSQIQHLQAALLLQSIVHLIWHPRCQCSRPRGIAEDMNIGEINLFTKSVTLLKFFNALTRKTHHNVCSDGYIRHRLPNQRHCLFIILHRIMPPHPSKQSITAALQRQMKVPT